MIKLVRSEQKVVTYPKLMTTKEGAVILFTRRDTGVCISPSVIGGPEIPHNHFGEFVSGLPDECFTDYPGSVTLSNE